MNFKEIVKSRYAAKSFDSDKLISDEQLNELKELIRMSASSIGLQPFVVKVVRSKELQARLQEKSWGQKQIGSASDVLVFCANTDVESRISEYENMMASSGIPEDKVESYGGMARGYLSKLSSAEILKWAGEQTFIALGNALNGAKYLGFDSCPIGGFEAGAYSDILGLSADLTPVVVLPIGFANDEAKPKMRFSVETLFENA